MIAAANDRKPSRRGASMRLCAVITLLAALLAPSAAAEARGIYLNGVNIEGVTNQDFRNCTVRIDAEGSVWIDSKDYIVKPPDGREPPRPQAAEPPAATAPAAKRYWLVTEISRAGRGGYDIDVYVNNKWIKKVVNTDEQIVMDITKHCVQGPNVIKFASIKAKGTASVPGSKAYTNVIIGEGSAGGNNVVIDKTLLEYKRSAVEADPFVNEYTITLK
jgi:hypothetical protein